MNWYLEVLKKYAVFEGRARRKEYWMFILFNDIFLILAGGAIFTLSVSNTIFIIFIIYLVAMIIPTISVTVRRLHDIGYSGFCIFHTVYSSDWRIMDAYAIMHRRANKSKSIW